MRAQPRSLHPSLSASRWSRCAEPHEPLSSLRVWLFFESLSGLERSLDELSQHLKAQPQLRRALLQVAYRPELLSAEAGALHEAFMRAHPSCSSYLPLCLPGAHSEGLRAWASPESCGACLYREAGSCAGLGPHSEAPQGLRAAGALRDPYHEASAELSAALDTAPWFTDPPLAYWRPNAELCDWLAAQLSLQRCQTFWDIGAGNGALGDQLCPESLSLVSVEPLSIYRLPPRATVMRAGASEALAAATAGELPKPDCMLISWPPPTRSFRALVDELEPRLVIRAFDRDGFCGARSDHRALILCEGSPSAWWRASDCERGYDERRPQPGYELLLSAEVESLYDARQGLAHSERQGLIHVYQRAP